MTVLSQNLLNVDPAGQDDVILFERLAKWRAGHGLNLALPPGGAPIRMIHGDRLRFRVVVRARCTKISVTPGCRFWDRCVGASLDT